MEKKPLVVIAGPTASGKTALSLDVAQHFGGEIVSADSMQVYRQMDIGTAKPTRAERRGIKHFLIDEAAPCEDFNLARYTSLAHKYIARIHEKGKLPVLVGGTGLYIDTVVNALELGEARIDVRFREELARIAKERGGDYLHSMLRGVDPEAAQRLNVNDLRRVIRALEVYHTSGMTITEQQKRSRCGATPYHTIWFMPQWDREALYQRINARVDAMLDAGLYDEVKALAGAGYGKNLTSMQGIGYKEMLNYYYGRTTWDETGQIIKRSTRRYAKRQLSWFRRNKQIISLPAPDEMMSAKCIKQIEAWLCESSKKII